MADFGTGDRVHFVGIGGVSMSALAELLAARGCHVTGSDREASGFTDRLTALGIEIQIGHSEAALGPADAVVYTSALPPNNPELAAARDRGIPTIRRAEFLAGLVRGKQLVGVAGTHGKTTTTAMVGSVLSKAGWDPTVLVGGLIRGAERNLQVGAGRVWVVEADEFDRSFLTLRPRVGVVTNLEADHLDSYGDLGAIEAAFEQYLGSIQAGGFAVICGDFPAVQDLCERVSVDRISFGLDPGNRIRGVGVTHRGFASRFEVRDGPDPLGIVRLNVPGIHNVRNALAAAAVGIGLGVGWDPIAEGLKAFKGVRRRFEILGEAGGVTVVNDYAHHPTEIRATLRAAREGWDGRIIAAFQPHLFTRTRDFADEFGEALAEADRIWLTDIYPAREAPIPGVTGRGLVERVQRSGGEKTFYAADLAALRDGLLTDVVPGDLLVVMGAGDVERVAREVTDGLRARS